MNLENYDEPDHSTVRRISESTQVVEGMRDELSKPDPRTDAERQAQEDRDHVIQAIIVHRRSLEGVDISDEERRALDRVGMAHLITVSEREEERRKSSPDSPPN